MGRRQYFCLNLWEDVLMGWIDLSPRSNGFVTGDVIENPAYIIESLIRDEACTIRDLKIDTIVGVGFISNGIPVKPDDYYNGATVINTSEDHKRLVIDYVSSTNALTLDSGPFST